MARKQKRNTKKRTLYTLLVLLCLGIGIGLLFTPTFEIDDVLCEGQVRLDRMTLTQSAEHTLGKNIFLVQLSDVAKSVEEIPLVEKATVRRVFPNKLKIVVEECIPAAYIATENQYIEVDLKKKVLDVIQDERVQAMTELFTPRGEPQTAVVDMEASEEGQNSQAEAEETQAREIQDARVHPVPIVMGLELEKYEIGKKAQSKNEALLEQAFSLFQHLEDAGLLVRTTYLDLTDINQVVMVVENRLEIYLGTLENMAYRCQFLAKIINERISSTEHAVLDYRGDDVYVRPPEDGKERMKPTATEEPEDEEGEEEEESIAQQEAEEPSSSATEKPAETSNSLAMD